MEAELISTLRQQLLSSQDVVGNEEHGRQSLYTQTSLQRVVLIHLHMSEFRWPSGGNVRGEDYSEMKRYFQ